MNRSKCSDFEVDLGDVVLVGDLELVDESFDHEFGVQKAMSVRASNIQMLVDVMGEVIDVSTSVSAKTYQRVKELLEEEGYAHMIEGHLAAGDDS